jgi:tetratricopeptide (TPR) repeat protein
MVLVALVIFCSPSLFAQQGRTAADIRCSVDVAAAGARRGPVVANDCAAAKARLQFSNRAGKSPRTRIYDLNESALAAIEDGRRDAIEEAVQKLKEAGALAENHEDRSCQAAILNNLGMAHYYLAEFDDSITAFTKAAHYAKATPSTVPPIRPDDYASFTSTPGTFTCFGQRITANEILTNRGLANLRAKHLQEAERDYDTVADDRASDRELDLLDMLATAALDRNDYNEAVRISGKMRQASVAPLRLRRARTIEGLAYARAGRLGDALVAYEAAAAAGAPSDETQGNVHRALGDLYMQLEAPRASAAIEQYDKAVALIKERGGKDRVAFGHAVAVLRKGTEMNNAADIRGGIQELLPFKTEEARGYIASGYNQLGEFDTAGAEYEALPSDTFITPAVACYSNAKNWTKVVALTDKALASARGTEEQRVQWTELRGFAHHCLDHRELSRADLEKVAAKRYPNADRARAANVILAASYLKDNRWDEAGQFSEAALATPFPASERNVEAAALHNAAIAYAQQKPPSFSKAVAAYERLLVLQPGNRGVRLLCANAHAGAGDAAKAAALYEELIVSGDVPPYVFLHMANRAFCARRFDDAGRLYRQATSIPGARIRLADLLYIRGRQARPLAFNDDLAAADAQYASIHPADDLETKHIAAMRGHIAYLRHDWTTALRFYKNADSTDATIRELVETAIKAKERGDMTIDPIGAEELEPKC